MSPAVSSTFSFVNGKPTGGFGHIVGGVASIPSSAKQCCATTNNCIGVGKFICFSINIFCSLIKVESHSVTEMALSIV